jgi:outer membrane cobalamin receptor
MSVPALVLVVALSTLQADPSSAIRGVVVDATAMPVAGAVITLVDSGRRVTSAADGTFDVPVDAGAVLVTVEAPGLAPRTVRLAAADAPARITLLPQAVREQVVVTATRGSESTDPAAPISVLTRSDLELAPSPVLDDVLRAVPGFSLFRRTSSRAANPTTQGASLRGLSASGASRALVLADGATLNDPFGGWVYWNRVPQASIDRVEVVRGGVSDLYGADALAGVIQVFGVTPRAPTLRAIAEWGSRETPRASVFTGTRQGPWTASVSGEASRTDGAYVIAEEDRGAVDTRAGSDYLVIQGAVGRDTDSGWRLRLSGNAYGESRENGTRLQLNSTGIGAGRLDASGPLFGGAIEAYGQASDQVYRQTFSAIDDSRATERLTVRQRVPSSSIAVGTTFRALFGAADVLGGVEMREVVATNHETSFAPNGVARPTTHVPGFSRTTGFFGQVRTNVNSRTTVVGGVRGDVWQRSRGGGLGSIVVWSPRVSVSALVTDRITVRGAVHKSFRAPTLNERYRAFRVGSIVTNANAALEPEELVTVEGGVLVQAGPASLRATVFDGSLDHAITNVTLTATPDLITRQRQNAGGVRARGIEAEGEYRLRAGISVLGSLAWTRSRFADTPGLTGNRVPQVPMWQGTGSIRWTAPSNVVVAAQLRLYGDQFEDDRNTLTLDGAALTDVTVMGSPLRRASWFAAVENLFDVDYDTGRTPLRTIGTPRTVRVGIRLTM